MENEQSAEVGCGPDRNGLDNGPCKSRWLGDFVDIGK